METKGTKKETLKFNYVLVGGGRFGNPNDGKGMELEYSLLQIRDKGIEYKVFCEDIASEVNDKNIKKGVFGGYLYRYILRGIQLKLVPDFNAVKYCHNIFDYCVSKKIRKLKFDNNYPTIFHSYGEKRRSILVAKKKGWITILQAESAESEWNCNLLEREYIKLGLSCSRKKEEFVFPNNILGPKYVDHIFALSSYVKETYVKSGFPEGKISILPLGVDTKRFKPDKTEKDETTFRVLFLSDIWIIKGLHYLLEAWRQLVEEKLIGNDAKLIIVGRFVDISGGQYEHYVKNIVKDLDNVIFTNKRVNPLEYYQKSDIYILPSLSDSFGKTVLEAMSCEIPVIITKNTVGDDIVTLENGFIGNTGDVEFLKEKILYFYRNRDQMKKMGKNARELVEREYKWDDYSKRLFNLIQEVLNNETN